MKTILGSILAVILIISCSKKITTVNTSLPAGYINATINDTPATFNYKDSALVTNFYLSKRNTTIYALFIGGYRDKKNKSYLSIDPITRTHRFITPGMYISHPPINGDTTSRSALLTYSFTNKSAAYPYGAWFGHLTGDSINLSMINITHIDSANIQGTFYGKLYRIKEEGIRPEFNIIDTLDTRTIKGEFNLPLTYHYYVDGKMIY